MVSHAQERTSAFKQEGSGATDLGYLRSSHPSIMYVLRSTNLHSLFGTDISLEKFKYTQVHLEPRLAITCIPVSPSLSSSRNLLPERNATSRSPQFGPSLWSASDCRTPPPSYHQQRIHSQRLAVLARQIWPALGLTQTVVSPVYISFIFSMATLWRTEPITMDNPLMRPSASNLHKPQVFVKVEFGVSWSAQHAPRRHAYEYKSRGLRERAPDFPRHVPAPTTNYLAATSIEQFQQHQVPQFYYHPLLSPEQPPNDKHRLWESQAERNTSSALLQPDREGRRRARVEAIPEPPPLGSFSPADPRPSRADRPASTDRHERGHSAPPPLSDNRWDVVQPEVAAPVVSGSSTACESTARRPVSDMGKDLPQLPTRFRLGEEGMPWEGTWTFPMGFEPFLEPDPYLQPSSSHIATGHQPFQTENPPRLSEQPTSCVINDRQSPIERRNVRSEDAAPRHELEALGSAMMTVDNGFENQWWNQGSRKHLMAIQPSPATHQQVEEQMALGWVGALLSPEETVQDSSISNMVVSPVSSYSGPVTGLSRSLSTRSEELWFTSNRCERYA